jgi:hypothetical protein
VNEVKNRRETIVLFEDKGAEDFFERLRPELGLENVVFRVGSGWIPTYKCYEELAQENDPRQIIPVLDADTITDPPPRTRTILRNPNLFRFSVDFEWAFDDWMLTDAIAKFLKEAGVPLSMEDPAHLVALNKMVQSARLSAWNTKTPIYLVLKKALAEWLTCHEVDATSFPLPDKAKLADNLGRRLAGLHELPSEVEQLVCRIQQTADLGPSDRYERAVWRMNTNRVVESTISDLRLQGEILLTIDNRLYILHLPQGKLSQFGPDEPIYYASWSPDCSMIAANMIHSRSGTTASHLVILSRAGAILSEINQGIPTGGPTEPCWHHSGESLLVKHNGPILSVSVDGERWSKCLGEDTGAFCQATGRFRARTVQGGRYSLELGRSWNALSPVDGSNDVRGRISWSHTGDRLAFTEYQLSENRGCVAVVNKQDRLSRVATPLAWSPYWVSWSPDDRFVAFSCLADHGDRPLRIVDVKTGEVRCLLHSTSEIVMGCRAWGL